MSIRDKFEFCFLMGRYSSASLADCQRLLRFAATLKRLNSDDSEDATRKKIRVQRKVMALCSALGREARFDRFGVVHLGLSENAIEVPA